MLSSDLSDCTDPQMTYSSVFQIIYRSWCVFSLASSVFDYLPPDAFLVGIQGECRMFVCPLTDKRILWFSRNVQQILFSPEWFVSESVLCFIFLKLCFQDRINSERYTLVSILFIFFSGHFPQFKHGTITEEDWYLYGLEEILFILFDRLDLKTIDNLSLVAQDLPNGDIHIN